MNIITNKVKALLIITIINLSIASCTTSISSGSSIGVINENVSVDAEINPYRIIETINGHILVEKNAKVGFLKTVNGDIYLEENVIVNGGISTTNGNVIIAKGGLITGDITTFSGNVVLQEANIKGSVVTVGGDINASDSTVNNLNTIAGNIRIMDSIVTGDININKSRLRLFEFLSPVNWFIQQKVIIDNYSEVRGSINIASSSVDLYVHDSSSLGNVNGAEVTLFTTEEP